MDKEAISCISFNTPLGYITLEATQNKLKKVRLGEFCNVGMSSEKNVARGFIPRLLIRVKKDILDYLKGSSAGVHPPPFNYRLDTSNLSAMQIKLLKELKKIPYGKTISYKELANKIGTSPRACGRLLASNPFPIIIPCHRVIKSNGSLGGYSGGIKLKKHLLKLEKSQTNK